MCGIFGLVDWRAALDVGVLERATRMLRHRGPDDEGYLLADWQTGRVVSCGGPDCEPSLRLAPLNSVDSSFARLAFGHRRLSIIDISPGGHQPMAACGDRVWIIYNGEIYNYLELRAELCSLGFSFRSNSDTEVILAAYEAWGQACVNRFLGMFALAILDLRTARLFLARDFFGIKPMYVAHTREGFAFASEIHPLLALPGVSRRVNPRRVYDYLRFGVTDDGTETMFADIRQVPAAHHLTLDLNRPGHSPTPVQYWRPVPSPAPGSFAAAADELRELVLDSIRLHLRSDVPVGSCLSGGVDSSSIVAAMRLVGGVELDLHTFTYVADDPKLDEERWADAVGTYTSSTMHKVRATHAELIDDLDELVTIQGEPFPSTSIYAQYRVFKLAQNAGMKVMLDGQGADELFLGYLYFVSMRLAELLRSLRFGSAAVLASGARANGQVLQTLVPQSVGRLAPRMLEPLVDGLALRCEREGLDRAWFERHNVPMVSLGWESGARLLRKEMERAVFRTSLPGLLRYEDRNSMAMSIESRVPFLTPQLASFVFSLPSDYLISPQALTKAVLRQSMQGLVPTEVLDRRDKIGFATPQGAWLSGLRDKLVSALSTDVIERVPALDAHAVRHTLAEVAANRAAISNSRLWRWYNLACWADRFSVEF